MSSSRHRHPAPARQPNTPHGRNAPKPNPPKIRSPFFKAAITVGLVGLAGLGYWYASQDGSDRHHRHGMVQHQNFLQSFYSLEHYVSSRKQSLAELASHSDRRALRLLDQTAGALSRELGRQADTAAGAEDLPLAVYLSNSFICGKRYPDLDLLPDAYRVLDSDASRLYARLDSAGFQKIDERPFEDCIRSAQEHPSTLASVFRGQRVAYLGDLHASASIIIELTAALPDLRRAGLTDLLLEYPSDWGVDGLLKALRTDISQCESIQAQYSRSAAVPGAVSGGGPFIISEYARLESRRSREFLKLIGKARSLGIDLTLMDEPEGDAPHLKAGDSSATSQYRQQVESSFFSPSGLARRNAVFAKALTKRLSNPRRRALALMGGAHSCNGDVPALVMAQTGLSGPTIQFGSEYSFRHSPQPQMPQNAIEHAWERMKLPEQPLLIPVAKTGADFDFYYHLPVSENRPYDMSADVLDIMARVQGGAGNPNAGYPRWVVQFAPDSLQSR